jgi:hypothetical protein
LEKFLKACEYHDRRELRLIYDCPTRWNSVYDMLSRALYLRPAIEAFLDKDPKLSKLRLSDSEWDKAELMLAILRPFKIASVRLQGMRKPGIDKVFYYYESLFDDIDKVKVQPCRLNLAYGSCRYGFAQKSKSLESKSHGFLLFKRRSMLWHTS